MKHFILGMAFFLLASFPVNAQKDRGTIPNLQNHIEETQKTVLQSYGSYDKVIETIRKKLAAENPKAVVTHIASFPLVAKGYYQVKLTSKAYIIEYDFNNDTKRTVVFDSNNAPASVIGRMSADKTKLFVITSKGKDGLTSIFMYYPSGNADLVTKCKSVKCKEYYAEVEQLPDSKYPDKNLFTYDGYRISRLTNDPLNPILQSTESEGASWDPFDEDLIDATNKYEDYKGY